MGITLYFAVNLYCAGSGTLVFTIFVFIADFKSLCPFSLLLQLVKC